MSYTNGTSNRGGYEQIGPEAPLLDTGPSSDGSKVFSFKIYIILHNLIFFYLHLDRDQGWYILSLVPLLLFL